MLDQKISEHARIVVNYSCKVKRGDFVVIMASELAKPLISEIVSELGKVGARYTILYHEPSIERSYLLSADEGTLGTSPTQLVNLFRDLDVLIQIISSANSQELSDVPPEKLQLQGRARGPILKIIEPKRWNITLHPTDSLAQDAGMSLEGYSDFVYSSILRDWPKMASEMKVLEDAFSKGRRVRITGEETDISFSIEGRKAIVDAGEKNLPGGEVFISPVESSVNGKVYFDLPINYQSQDIKGARLVFEKGEIIKHSAETGQELLSKMLATDEGARRLGELGIGMNRGINRFTKNILFDEKMGDTVHMAVGLGFDESAGTGNQSAIHIDMIKNMKEGGAIYFDDSHVYKDGKFTWE